MNDDSKGKILSSNSVKIFRNLSEKYDLSLTINEHESVDKSEEEKKSKPWFANYFERIKKGESFKTLK